MPMKVRANLALALLTVLVAACGGDSPAESSDAGATINQTRGCTERDGGWFGRSEDGARIISQTREACEERLGN